MTRGAADPYRSAAPSTPHGHFSVSRTTPNLIDVVVVIVASAAGVDVHTCQFRSMI